MKFFFFILILLLIVLTMCLSCLCIVPQGNAWVIERLGKYSATWHAGLHLKTPLLEKVVRKISLKEQVADFEPQSVITKDNVTMNVDSVVFNNTNSLQSRNFLKKFSRKFPALFNFF